MKELRNVRQIPGEPPRRWFFSPDFDLIVWLSDDQEVIGFELCYDKRRQERAISWRQNTGFRHMAIDDGEQRPGRHKSSPVPVADGDFDAPRVHAAFLAASQALPKEVVRFVAESLERYARDIRGQATA